VPRPSKLSTEIQESLCAAVARGVPLRRACQAAGVAYSTVRGWVRRGRSGRGAAAAFRAALERARAEDLAGRIAQLNRCCAGGFVTRRTTRTDAQGNVTVEETITPPDFRAIAWYLERVEPYYFWIDKKRLREIEKGLAALEKAQAAAGPPLHT
jgi:hypothetical protein